MENENIETMLVLLRTAMQNEKNSDDYDKIKDLYNQLSNLDKKKISLEELKYIENNVTYLDVKYDELNELSYYFSPICSLLERELHNLKVQKIREENRKKRSYFK